MRKFLIYALVGFLFLFFQITSRDLAVSGNIDWTLGYSLRTVFLSLLGGAVAGLLGRYGSGIRVGRPTGAGPDGIRRLSPRQAGLISFVLIVLCRLPFYLAYYPGICAYDVTIQTGQIVGNSYNDHHPIAHTLLLAGSMKLGKAWFGDVNTGIAIMVFGQLLLLAGAFAWGLALLHKRQVSGDWLFCLQIFGMFYPFHMYMSVSVIKDVFFSIFFLLQMLALCEMIRRKNRRPDGYALLFFGCSVGMQLFRNNGRYAMLVLVVTLVISTLFGKENRRFWGTACVNCVAALVTGSLCLSGLFAVTNAAQGDRREMLSMPIQQLARCMLYHGGVGVLPADDGTMEEQDRSLINDFLLDEGYREYRPEISDPVKAHTNTYVVRYRAGDFVKTYLHLLGRYPGDFINAALAVNAGYLYVGDESHATVNQNGSDRGLGYVQTRWVESELNPRGIYRDSKWSSLYERLEKWADSNAYLRIPVLKYLFVPGVFLWLYLLLAGSLLACRNYDKCVPLSLAAGYYVTLFLGPVVQLRYLYPLMLALPFLALMLLWRDRDKG